MLLDIASSKVSAESAGYDFFFNHNQHSHVIINNDGGKKGSLDFQFFCIFRLNGKAEAW